MQIAAHAVNYTIPFKVFKATSGIFWNCCLCSLFHHRDFVLWFCLLAFPCVTMCDVCECVFNYLRNNGLVHFLTLPLEGSTLQIQDVGFRQYDTGSEAVHWFFPLVATRGTAGKKSQRQKHNFPPRTQKINSLEMTDRTTVTSNTIHRKSFYCRFFYLQSFSRSKEKKGQKIKYLLLRFIYSFVLQGKVFDLVTSNNNKRHFISFYSCVEGKMQLWNVYFKSFFTGKFCLHFGFDAKQPVVDWLKGLAFQTCLLAAMNKSFIL